jgi:gliding motility-associated-like protein
MITLADISRGYVENSATAIGFDPNNNQVEDISDDPTNFADVDVENDNEPDDPTVIPTPNVHVYEVFTPNDDGINDHFVILGIESFPHSVVKIYNRWGSLVFQTEAYNNTDNYWDGYSQGDKNHKLPVGVYYYVIDLGIPDIENIFTGSIYLNR